MSKQSKAIGSKGQNSIATGPKEKAGHDKVVALRNQFDGIATLFAATDVEVGKAQSSKLAATLEAAELTANSADNRKMLHESLTNALLAVGNKPQTVKQRVSEALKVCAAYYLSVTVKTEKDGTITIGKPGSKGNTTGHSILNKASGYHDAVKLAGKIKAANGKAQKGHKTKAQKEAERVWTKGDCVDAIDTLVKAVRVLPGIPSDCIDKLLAVKLEIQGKKRARVGHGLVAADRAIPPTLTNKNGKAVVKGSAQWQAMSRGQKAAATRRFHNSQQTQRLTSNQVH
jgi:hypothetical protein